MELVHRASAASVQVPWQDIVVRSGMGFLLKHRTKSFEGEGKEGVLS